MKIYFHAPGLDAKRPLPVHWDDDWRRFGDGVGLTYQLFFCLRENGLDVEIGTQPPEEGIICSHASSFIGAKPPAVGHFRLCLQLDWPRDVWSHAHLVANRHQLEPRALTPSDRIFWCGPRYLITHMPQLGLVRRDPSRDSRFERVAYFGMEKNLSESFRGSRWREALRNIGLEWHMATEPSQWADYSQCDAILALREEKRLINRKPAQKLYNAWIAGVIPILGPERGFREEGVRGEDYIEVSDAAEALEALAELKRNNQLRERLINNGAARRAALAPEVVAAEWADEFRNRILPEASSWLREPLWKRRAFLTIRSIRYRLQSIRRGHG